MIITGTTAIVGIVGHPIMQVKSPGVMNAYFESKRHDAALLPIDLQPDAIPAFVTLLHAWDNLRGMIVTVPFKQVLAPLVDHLTPRAARLGTVNVIRRDQDGTLHGDILDGLGFTTAMQSHNVDAKGRAAAVIGAGGVASAVANALCESGVASLTLQDPDTTKQDRLIATLKQAFPAIAISSGITTLSGLDILVNGTPVGMNNDPNLPLPKPLLQDLHGTTFVADVVTAPAMTPFLLLAQQRGCTIQTGPEMTETQMLHLARFMHVAAPGDEGAT
jgi:shikimate dehydrogenase